MDRWKAGFVLVLAIFGSHCHQAPATTKHYEVGNLYTYDYILGLELNEPNSENGTTGAGTPGSTVGYKILSQIQVRPVWQNEPGGTILEIQLVKPQLQIKSRKAPQPEGFRDHTSDLDHAQFHPLFVHWKDGQVKKTFSVNGDVTSLLNIKKGIANILQVQPGNGEVEENTPRGLCKVNYQVEDKVHLTKTLIGACEPSPDAPFPFATHNSFVLGSDVESDIRVKVKVTPDAMLIDEADISETHVIRVTAKKEVGATILASQHFKLSGTTSSSDKIVKATTADAAIKEIAKTKGLQLVPDSLIPQVEKFPVCEAAACKTSDVITRTMTNDNMATTKMSSAFIQMVGRFREMSKEEIQKIVKPNLNIFPQLLDICAATGTMAAHTAAMSVLKFKSEDKIEKPERYLLGLSLSPAPSPEIVTDIFNLAKSKIPSTKLKETLILTTASLVHTVRLNKERVGSSSDFGSDIEDFLVKSLKDCAGSEMSDCQNLYLRALKNLKSPKSVPILFEYVQQSDQKVSVVAMKTIHAFSDKYIERKYRPVLVKVVKQLGNKYDSSVRTLAVDVLLRNNPTREELREILHLIQNLSDPQHSEVTTFLWNRIHEFMETNPQLETMLWDLVAEYGYKNYHHLSPRGLSTAFTRVVTSTPTGNSSFSNAIEMQGKILKRSSFDVYIKSHEDALQMLSLGIFAGGLSSFASSEGETESEPETEDATAGMELTVMGVQMRPIVFFVGKGELMGLVWSGAGSDRTTALQGNVLLQDERRAIPLYSGLVADVNIQGGLSFDLAGQIQLSLWHRTANSLVENKAGVVLQSIVRVDTSFVRSRVDYTVAAEAALHFTSDINFYDGVLMCLKLTQPEFIIKQNIHKTERIPGSKHRLRKAKYNSTPVPGITYALNKKNSQLCGVMYKDEL